MTTVPFSSLPLVMVTCCGAALGTKETELLNPPKAARASAAL